MLSGRPLAVLLLDRESFDLFIGLGVPGPFTFLPGKRETIITFCKCKGSLEHFTCCVSQSLPIWKSRSISRKHDSVHPVHTTGAIFPSMTNHMAFGKAFTPFQHISKQHILGIHKLIYRKVVLAVDFHSIQTPLCLLCPISI